MSKPTPSPKSLPPRPSPERLEWQLRSLRRIVEAGMTRARELQRRAENPEAGPTALAPVALAKQFCRTARTVRMVMTLETRLAEEAGARVLARAQARGPAPDPRLRANPPSSRLQ